MYRKPHLISVGPLELAAWPWAPWDQVAAVADAAVATDRAPAAAMTMALDRLSRIFRCRDKGTFR
jgi:hypothetical protein